MSVSVKVGLLFAPTTATATASSVDFRCYHHGGAVAAAITPPPVKALFAP